MRDTFFRLIVRILRLPQLSSINHILRFGALSKTRNRIYCAHIKIRAYLSSHFAQLSARLVEDKRINDETKEFHFRRVNGETDNIVSHETIRKCMENPSVVVAHLACALDLDQQWMHSKWVACRGGFREQKHETQHRWCGGIWYFVRSWDRGRSCSTHIWLNAICVEKKNEKRWLGEWRISRPTMMNFRKVRRDL